MSTTATDAKQNLDDGPLLTITEDAAERLEGEMQENDEAQALKLLAQEGCCGIGYAMAMAAREPEEDEHVVTEHGVTVYLDDATLDLVKGAKIAWTEGVFGAGFSIENPNEAESDACGCR